MRRCFEVRQQAVLSAYLSALSAVSGTGRRVRNRQAERTGRRIPKTEFRNKHFKSKDQDSGGIIWSQ